MTRTHHFTIPYDRLVRHVNSAICGKYQHICSIDTFEAVAMALECVGGRQTSCVHINDIVGGPFLQIYVAMNFLAYQGLIHHHELGHGSHFTVPLNYSFDLAKRAWDMLADACQPCVRTEDGG